MTAWTPSYIKNINNHALLFCVHWKCGALYILSILALHFSHLYFYRPELTPKVPLSSPTQTLRLLTTCCPPTPSPQVNTSPPRHPRPHLQLVCPACPPPSYPSTQKRCSPAVDSAARCQMSPQGVGPLHSRLLRLLHHGKMVPLRTHACVFQPTT